MVTKALYIVGVVILCLPVVAVTVWALAYGAFCFVSDASQKRSA